MTERKNKKVRRHTGGFLPAASYTLRKATTGRTATRNGLLKWVGCLLCLLWCLTLTAQAQPVDESVYEFNIPSQPLIESLNALSNRTETLVLFPYDLVKNREATAVTGRYTVREALDAMLVDTGLIGGLTEKGVLMISARGSLEANQSQGSEGKETMDTKKTVITAAIAYLLSGGSVQSVWANDGATETVSKQQTDKLRVEEIVVTATKRETRLQDVPMSITAISGEMIEKRGLHQMSDYLNSVPGVTMQDRGGRGNSITIRGVAADPQNEDEAVGAYFGETPLDGLFVESGFGDVKFVDIERIEVLRGPQGTLYGSGSMGGTVRIMPAQPNLNEFEGKVSMSLSDTAEYGGTNTIFSGVVNIPLVDETLAVRAVAYKYDTSGYVKNIAASYEGEYNIQFQKDYGGILKDGIAGGTKTDGARVSLLWQPTDALDITLSHLWQESTEDGLPAIDSFLPGKYSQARAMPGNAKPNYFSGHSYSEPEGTYSEINVTSLLATYTTEWGEFVSASSWLDSDNQIYTDIARTAPFVGHYFGSNEKLTDFFVQELRFASSFDGPLQVFVGAYYEDKPERVYGAQGFVGDYDNGAELAAAFGGADLSIPEGAPEGFSWVDRGEVDVSYDNDIGFSQTAYFGELSYAFSDALSATVGARHFEYEQSSFQLTQGFWNDALFPEVYSDVAGENKGETYMANMNWKPSDDFLLYATWSEGFRPGEALAPLSPGADPENTGFFSSFDDPSIKLPVRAQSDPDTLTNYELGVKGTIADGRVTFDAAVYHIDWEGLPVRVLAYDFINGEGHSAGSQLVNAGKADLDGVELQTRIKINDAFKLDFNASYNEATLAEAQPALGEKGDELPGSADYNLSLGAEYSFDLSGYLAFARVDYSYLSEFDTQLKQPDSVPKTGGYGLFNVKIAMEIGEAQLEFFVNNLANVDDISWRSYTVSPNGSIVYRVRPRTIGLNLSYQF